MRRSQSSIVANPVLVGAVTTLVVVVAVFLAYNANNGLPFVPTTHVKVQIANGANLVKGNEVRSGGYRIGVVEEMKPVSLPRDQVGAELSLKLDKSIGDLPVDTKVTIRPRSALGLKYVELEKGTSQETLSDGDTLPLKQTSVPIELDEFYNVFDEPTRDASQRNLEGFGNAFVGRGYDVNRLIQVAPKLLGHLEGVMRNLSNPRTNLEDFFKELGDTVRVVAPVSAVNARLFTTMANTFEAFSRDTDALQDTISKSPETLRVSTDSLEVQRPFLNHLASMSVDLREATGELRGALPPLNDALAVGTPVTRKSVRLYTPLRDTLTALNELVSAPATNAALRGLTATVTTLQPQLRYLGPYITVCNTWNIFWTFTAEHFTAPDNTGGSERTVLNNGDDGPDNVTSIGANEFVHGVPGVGMNGGRPQHLHRNLWGNTAIEKGEASCQTGQAGYLYAANKYGPHGKTYERAVVDTPTRADYPDFPRIGPHFKTFNKEGKGSGTTRPRVPAGQTYTDDPGGIGVNP
jgi:virulence factor Mce-like protein